MTTSTDLEVLLKGFLTKLPPRSSQSIGDRILHWSDVANNPHMYTGGDPSPFAIASRRKLAIQSLKKYIARNPVIAAKVLREKNESEAA